MLAVTTFEERVKQDLCIEGPKNHRYITPIAFPAEIELGELN